MDTVHRVAESDVTEAASAHGMHTHTHTHTHTILLVQLIEDLNINFALPSSRGEN